VKSIGMYKTLKSSKGKGIVDQDTPPPKSFNCTTDPISAICSSIPEKFLKKHHLSSTAEWANSMYYLIIKVCSILVILLIDVLL
jgi:hypothetical protein